MEAGKYNVKHTAGASFKLELLLKVDGGGAFDLTGCTAFAHVRKQAGHEDVLIDLDPAITDAVGGEITIEIEDEVTANWKAGFWKWDVIIELADGSVTEPIVSGSFLVSKSVTKK